VPHTHFVPGPSCPGPNRQYPNGRNRIGRS